MQNNEKQQPSGFRKFFRQKGYYIALGLCLVAIGVSAYVFMAGVDAEKNLLNEPSLSVATKAEKPGEKKVSLTHEDTAAVMNPDDAVREAAEQVRVWPVGGSTQVGYSMEKLSFNETTQDWRTHDGMDLCAVSGEPVLAASAGTVSAVFDDEYLGTTVCIAHEGGYVSQYSNLAPMPTVSVGQNVEAGQVIGAVGTSALLEISQQPHLHFSIACNGKSVDPAEFFA